MTLLSRVTGAQIHPQKSGAFCPRRRGAWWISKARNWEMRWLTKPRICFVRLDFRWRVQHIVCPSGPLDPPMEGFSWTCYYARGRVGSWKMTPGYWGVTGRYLHSTHFVSFFFWFVTQKVPCFFCFQVGLFLPFPKRLGFQDVACWDMRFHQRQKKGDHTQTFLLGASIFEDCNLNLTEKESDKKDMFNMGSLFQLKMGIKLNHYFVVTLQWTTMEHPSKLYSRCI